MAVTKIRRFSSWTLLLLVVISLVMLGLFYFGGSVAPENQIPVLMGIYEPTFTGGLLYWVYVLFFLVVLAVVLFSLWGFFTSFKHRPKKAVNSLIVLAIFAALLIVTYFMGDGTPLNIVGYEGPDNVPGILRLTDMWIYSFYALLALCILAMIVSPLIKMLKK